MRYRLLIAIIGASLLGLLAVTAAPTEACPPGGYGYGYGGMAYYYSAAPMYYSYQPMYYSTPMYQRPYGYSSYGTGYSEANTVGIYDDNFQPAALRVAPGTVLRFVNYGRHTHTVTSSEGNWDSGDIPPGGSWSATFRFAGTYYFYCRHHANMKGTVTVGSGGSGSSGY